MDLGEAQVLCRSLASRLDTFDAALVSPTEREALWRLVGSVDLYRAEVEAHQSTIARLAQTNQMLSDTGEELQLMATAYDEMRAAADSVQVDSRRTRARVRRSGPDLTSNHLTQQIEEARRQAQYFDSDPANCPWCDSEEHILCEEGANSLPSCDVHERYHIRCVMCWETRDSDLHAESTEREDMEGAIRLLSTLPPLGISKALDNSPLPPLGSSEE